MLAQRQPLELDSSSDIHAQKRRAIVRSSIGDAKGKAVYCQCFVKTAEVAVFTPVNLGRQRWMRKVSTASDLFGTRRAIFQEKQKHDKDH